MKSFASRLGLGLSAIAALSLMLAAPAEARRGGSFGSRGMRTYSAPRSYSGQVGPVQRSMTPRTQPYAQPGYGPSPYAAPPRAPFRPGFGTGFMGGLLTGGLIGAMSGHGWGWGGGGWGGGYGGGFGGGLISAIFQLAILGVGIWFLMRLFRRRRDEGAMAYQAAGYQPEPVGFPGPAPEPAYGGGPWGQTFGGGANGLEIPITPGDRADFERLLNDVQGAYAREDFAGLREHCTPEIVSFLSEELSQNAVQGRRNDVSGMRLLQLDVTEAWREGPADYATAALRYESIDVMRDRQSGAIVEGDPDHPTTTTELWTFVRDGGPWKLSAIQETRQG